METLALLLLKTQMGSFWLVSIAIAGEMITKKNDFCVDYDYFPKIHAQGIFTYLGILVQNTRQCHSLEEYLLKKISSKFHVITPLLHSYYQKNTFLDIFKLSGFQDQARYISRFR